MAKRRNILSKEVGEKNVCMMYVCGRWGGGGGGGGGKCRKEGRKEIGENRGKSQSSTGEPLFFSLRNLHLYQLVMVF